MSDKSGKVSKKKYYLMEFLKIISAILPLLILVVIRHEKYIYSAWSAVRFSVGGIIALVVIVLTLLEKLHIKGLGWSLIGLALTWFLEKLIVDIQWIFLCFFVGMLLSTVFGICAANEKEKFTIEKTAETTAKQMETVIKKYHGSGRV